MIGFFNSSKWSDFVIIIIIIIMSLFKENDIFSTKPNLTYGPRKSKTYLHGYIHMYKI